VRKSPTVLLLLRALVQIILVVQTPDRLEGEDAVTYNTRLKNDRILALNPNYSAE
jgi:hypothetical protein